jgi:acetyltransferase-like isoleucine patch superfamily enzyme
VTRAARPSRPLPLAPLIVLTLCRRVRAAWAILSAFVVESVVFGLAVLPGALFWEWHLTWHFPRVWLRVVVLAMVFVPAYMLFAVSLMVLSALSVRLLGWRTPRDREMRVADLDWPLLDWLRYSASTHIVRVFAGTFFRSGPVWTMYLRLNGARIGHRVFVNTLSVSDHNLLSFGDGTVVGSDVHIAGHTVEHGIVKTGAVRVGRDVTIGVGSVIMTGVEIGDACHVGALSVVPKGTRLEAGERYVGAPARPLPRSDLNDGRAVQPTA